MVYVYMYTVIVLMSILCTYISTGHRINVNMVYVYKYTAIVLMSI